VPIVLKSGSLNLLEPYGPVQACNGIASLLYIDTGANRLHAVTSQKTVMLFYHGYFFVLHRNALSAIVICSKLVSSDLSFYFVSKNRLVL
jgi:hypothetical protein